jgi:uncharacterized RDD family membrane protein YckC
MAEKYIDRSLGDGVYYAASDYVGLGLRIVIAIVDSLILLFAWALLAIAGQLVGLPGFFVLLGIVFFWWYEVPLKRSRFRTLGYWLTGSKIVNLRGERPSLFLLTVRALLTWGFGPYYWFFNLFWCGIDDDRQTLADGYAKTCLVKLRAEPIGNGSVQLAWYFAGGMALSYPRVVYWRESVTVPTFTRTS